MKLIYALAFGETYRRTNMKKTIFALTAAVTVVASTLSASAATPAVTNLVAHATGAQVTATSNMKMGGVKTGKATAYFVVNSTKNTVCYKVTTSGVAGIVAAHIHSGAVGMDGGVAVALNPAKFNKKAQTCLSVSHAVATQLAMNPNMFYFNVHSKKYSDGAVRGQLAAGM